MTLSKIFKTEPGFHQLLEKCKNDGLQLEFTKTRLRYNLRKKCTNIVIINEQSYYTFKIMES